MAIKRPEIEVRQLLVGDWALILKKQRESPQKQISKEVTAYNQVFYPESKHLLRRYSRDNTPSGAFRLHTKQQQAET